MAAQTVARFSRGPMVEALVLACSRTKLTEVVGADAMTTAVNSTYLAMSSEGVIDLQPLWDLLAEQPGFDPEPALDAMCKIKSWESALRVKIKRPTAVRQLKLEEQNKRARRVEVSDTELDRVLGLESAQTEDPEPKKRSRPRPEGWRRVAPWIAGAVALAGFAVAGSFAYQSCRGPAFHSVAEAELLSDIPLRNVRRLGKQVVANLADPTWLDLPAADKTRQLGAVFSALAENEVDSLVILDDQNLARASIQNQGVDTQVRFY